MEGAASVARKSHRRLANCPACGLPIGTTLEDRVLAHLNRNGDICDATGTRLQTGSKNGPNTNSSPQSAQETVSAGELSVFLAKFRETFEAQDQGFALRTLYSRFSQQYRIPVEELRKIVSAELSRNGNEYARLRRELVFKRSKGSVKRTPEKKTVAKPVPPPETAPPRIIDASEPVETPYLVPGQLHEWFVSGSGEADTPLELPSVEEVIELLRVSGYSEPDHVMNDLEAFIGNGRPYSGYLSWRLRELATRPVQVFDQTAEGVLRAMSSIVREDKQLIAKLEEQHGDFLQDQSDCAGKALEVEFGKLNLDESWTIPASALRRSRAASGFLRRAIVLTFASQDYATRLLPMLARLRPPAKRVYGTRDRLAHASVTNLRRMIAIVDGLFGGAETATARIYEEGLAELHALRDGDFDYLVDTGGVEVDRLSIPATSLPLLILPGGERIQPFIAGLRRSGRYRGGEIDAKRLDVLVRLWEHLSESGTCAMYEGAFPEKGEGNEYLVLAISYAGYGEDAVAISPLKGQHATFVVRADCCSRSSWKSVLSETKDEAKGLGARRLVFKAQSDYGLDEYEAMFQKVIALFLCKPDDFESGQLYFDIDEGRYRVRGA